MEDFEFDFIFDSENVRNARLSFLQIIPFLGSEERFNIGFILKEDEEKPILKILKNFKKIEKCLKVENLELIESSIEIIQIQHCFIGTNEQMKRDDNTDKLLNGLGTTDNDMFKNLHSIDVGVAPTCLDVSRSCHKFGRSFLRADIPWIVRTY